MKLTLLLLVFSLQLSLAAIAQQVSLSVKDKPLREVLDEIKRQSGYEFLFNSDLKEKSKLVTVSIKNQSIESALTAVFRDQPFSFHIEDKMIIVKGNKNRLQQRPVKGTITDTEGKPIGGVVVRDNNNTNATVTDYYGQFILSNIKTGAKLYFSRLGYKAITIDYLDQDTINLVMETEVYKIDEVVAIGYGSTTQRKNTGNVSKVTAETIAQQPVTNPLQALSGRVAGLEIVQSNGLPGTPIRVRIRGQNSIAAGNNPLYVIDGVPFMSDPIESLGGPQGDGTLAGNPLNAISPDDIQSIEILKDADATAIYGSRASNGVILITTKKARVGQTQLNAGIRSGFSRASRFADMLTTSQYLQVRRDALTNSGLTPDASNAPDLITWDASTDHNWPHWYMGGTAHNTDANATLSGGKDQTTFLFSGGYHNESTVLQGNTRYQRGNARLNVNHQSYDQRFKFSSTVFYVADQNLLSGSSGSDAFSTSSFIPNYPIFNEKGNYNWAAFMTNPVASLKSYYKSQTNNLNANAEISFLIAQGLTIKTSLGYNRIEMNEVRPLPIIAQNPAYMPTGTGQFGDRTTHVYLAEPQLLYQKAIGKGNLNLLLGSTIQSTGNQSKFILANGYTNDLLLESLNYGTIIYKSAATTAYRYLSFFGRANYEYLNRYIFNINLRRDGSSKFGPGKQYGNFGSVAAAWIFSEENLFKQSLNWLSYGKLRGSYGTTGNDAIGDYGYLNLYANTTIYGTENAIKPSQIPNNDFRWEVNKKLELALELGFLNDAILLKSAWYRNRSGNQLVGYSLPSTTGFSSYQANLPAVVQNTGWEFELKTRNIQKPNFKWSTSLNISLPKNKLLNFPGLASSNYAGSYVIGQPLSIVQKYHYLGTDPETGVALIDDINADGNITELSSYNNQKGDLIIAGYTAPKWFGGLGNSIEFNGISVDFLFQYVKQDGFNPYREYASFGLPYNNYNTSQLTYWKTAGDEGKLPKPFAGGSTSSNQFANSDATLGDASYFRLKTLSLGYTFSQKLISSLKIYALRLSLQGENLLTISPYKGYDPETAYITNYTTAIQVPSLRTMVIGLNITL